MSLLCWLSGFIQTYFDPTLPFDVSVDGHVYDEPRYEVRGGTIEWELAECRRCHRVIPWGWRRIA